MKQWAINTDGIQERFGVALCQAFGKPPKYIRVDSIDSDEAIINIYIRPPYGKNVIDSLNGTAPAAAVRMQAVRKCCCDFNANVESITLGEFGQYWLNPIDQGGKPYYCPSGWIRFGVKVAKDDKEFDANWGNWYVAY
ncbi:unnamed protein product, partial [Rotaria sordida]